MVLFGVMTSENSEVPTHERESSFIRTAFQERLAWKEAKAGIVPAEQLAPEERPRQYDQLREMIGNTPVLGWEGPQGSLILVKVESQNPSESHYDRLYVNTLQRLEEDGVIEPGDELWDVTSGSAGISLAWLAERLGYKTRIFAPPELPAARAQEIMNFGAQLSISEPGYIPAAVEAMQRARKQLRELGYESDREITDDYDVHLRRKGERRICLLNHPNNLLSVKSFAEVGREVNRFLPPEVTLDHFVSVLGNWTSTIGISNGLQERFPDLSVIGVEDTRNPAWFVKKHPGRYEQRCGHPPVFATHDSYGASYEGVDIKFADLDRLDEIRLADPHSRDLMLSELNASRPLSETFGNTSASAILKAHHVAEANPQSVILAIAYDKADRYGEPTLAEGVNIPVLVNTRQCVPDYPADLPERLAEVGRGRMRSAPTQTMFGDARPVVAGKHPWPYRWWSDYHNVA